MTTSRWRIYGVGWVVACLLAACGSPAHAPTATPLALHTPLPAAPSTPLPRVLAATDGEEVVFASPRYGYRVTLPCCWVAMPAPAAALELALAELDDDDLAGQLAARLHLDDVEQALELVAILPGDGGGAPQAQLTVAVLPRAGLTLVAYLEATRHQFDLIAATQVQSAAIDRTVRDDGVSAVVVEYITPGVDDGDAAIAGLQVALPSEGGDDFVVLTFTTTVDAFARLKPQFRDIVRLVQIEPPA